MTATVEVAGPFKIEGKPYTIAIAAEVETPKTRNWAAVLIVFAAVVIVVLFAGRRKKTAA